VTKIQDDIAKELDEAFAWEHDRNKKKGKPDMTRILNELLGCQLDPGKNESSNDHTRSDHRSNGRNAISEAMSILQDQNLCEY
jgi:hypothetical protein